MVHHVGKLGGGTKSLMETARMLSERYEVILCIPFEEKLEIEIPNKKIIVKKMSSVPYLTLFSGAPPLISKESLDSLKSLINIKKFCDELKQLKPDYILFNSIVTLISSLLINEIPCAFIDRETLTNSFSIYIYNKIINKKIKGAAFLCDYEKNKFSLNDSIVSTVIPDSVPYDDLKIINRVQRNKDKGKYKVLFMGGASRLKGSHIALEAAAQLDKKSVLIVAGDFNIDIFSYKNILKHFYNLRYCHFLFRLRIAYKKAKKNKNVIFAGRISNIYPWIMDSDLVIFPSTKVHQPRPCIEAGYFSKPVILSDYKETEEYFINGYNALTFKPNDAKDLARCINYAAGHRKEMCEMGENNYDMSTRLHDYNKTKKILNDFVCEIIGRD